jgi:hypothetical protein
LQNAELTTLSQVLTNSNKHAQKFTAENAEERREERAKLLMQNHAERRRYIFKDDADRTEVKWVKSVK